MKNGGSFHSYVNVYQRVQQPPLPGHTTAVQDAMEFLELLINALVEGTEVGDDDQTAEKRCLESEMSHEKLMLLMLQSWNLRWEHHGNWWNHVNFYCFLGLLGGS